MQQCAARRPRSRARPEQVRSPCPQAVAHADEDEPEIAHCQRSKRNAVLGPYDKDRRSMYRRNKTNGTWVLKASDGPSAYWTKGFALPTTLRIPKARTC